MSSIHIVSNAEVPAEIKIVKHLDWLIPLYEKSQISLDTQDSLEHLISKLQNPKSVEKTLGAVSSGEGERFGYTTNQSGQENQTEALDTNRTSDTKKKILIETAQSVNWS